MPNLASIYTRATRLPTNETGEDKPKEEDAGHFQARNAWKQSTITKEKVSNYESTIATLLDQCVDLATTFHQHGNPHKIIANLTKVSVLKQIIEDYGR